MLSSMGVLVRVDTGIGCGRYCPLCFVNPTIRFKSWKPFSDRSELSTIGQNFSTVLIASNLINSISCKDLSVDNSFFLF